MLLNNMMLSHHDADYYNKSAIVPIITACAGYMCFAQSQVIAKILGHHYHFAQIVFISQISLFIFSAIYGFIVEGKDCLHTSKPWLMLFRGFIGKVEVFVNFYTLPHVKLTSFYTIIFTAPLWITVLSALFLKDKVGVKRLSATCMGILVVFFIFRPWRDDFNIWVVPIFASALISAVEMITIRYIGSKESRAFMIASGALIGLVMAFPLMIGNYIEPNLNDLMLMLLSGVLMAAGLFFVSHAYQNTFTAATIAPYQYTQIVWGALFGYLIFREVPHIETVIGASLIIIIGIYMMYSERGYSYKKGRLIKHHIYHHPVNGHIVNRM